MRTEIRKVLEQKSVATAKHVAHASGLELKDVLAELNKMHADGEVEREKRNGNEYSYWLTATAPTKQEATPDASAPVTSNQASLQEVKEVINEVAQEAAAAATFEEVEIHHAPAVLASPAPIAPITFTQLEAAIQHIVEQLEEGIGIEIYSDGSIGVLDLKADQGYGPAINDVADCLDTIKKLRTYLIA
jgi:hypothetical protein